MGYVSMPPSMQTALREKMRAEETLAKAYPRDFVGTVSPQELAGKALKAEQFKEAEQQALWRKPPNTPLTQEETTGKYTLGAHDARNDPTKLHLELITPEMLEALGSVLTYGAYERYAPRDWEKGMMHSELFGSAQRHLLAYLQGQMTDESGLPHLWHAFCKIGMLLTMDTRRRDLDDLHVRPGPIV
jgi:hypothetical protein